MSDIHTLEQQLLTAIEAAPDEGTLEQIRVSALGKKGSISELLKSLGSLSPEERKAKGPLYNSLRDKVAQTIAARKSALSDAALDARLVFESIDATLPARPEPSGTIHPV